MTESLRRGKTVAVQMSSPRVAGGQDDVRLECRVCIRPTEGDPPGVGAEADHLGVVARARRESLRTDVESLEQVRLSCSVRAVQKHDSRLEAKLQAGVRAEVPERDLADDQPASRIGMIRYQKLSSGEAIRPGRRRLMSLN